MANGAFVSADINKLIEFETESAAAIKEFDAIKKKFDDINSTLLRKWKGTGANAYKKESDHILENIGGIRDILDGINNGAVKDIKESYVNLDKELGEYNKNPSAADSGAATSSALPSHTMVK